MSTPTLDPVGIRDVSEAHRGPQSADRNGPTSTRICWRPSWFRRWRWLVAFATVGLVIVAVTLLSRRSEELEVFVATAQYQDMQRLVTTNGTVFPTNEFQARAFWPGIIEKVYVELGDKVKPGQLLVTMKDPFALSRLATANAALQSAEVSEQDIRNGGSQEQRIGLKGDLQSAEIAEAQDAKSLAALKRLQLQGAASEAEVNAAQEKLKAAQASLATVMEKSTDRYSAGDLKSARAHTADAKATLDAAKIQFGNANITTPIAGTVYSIKVVDYD